MLFGRKHPEKWADKLRVMLWPRRSWSRSFKYVTKRVLRLTASPHAISAGVAAGVFASFTPFIGLHFIIAFIVAYFVAGNFIAAATGTFFGNPFSFPIIWASTHKLGTWILYGEHSHQEEHVSNLSDVSLFSNGISGIFDKIIGLWDPLVKPMLIGAFPLGITFGIIAYIATRWAAGVFRQARKHRIEAKLAKSIEE